MGSKLLPPVCYLCFPLMAHILIYLPMIRLFYLQLEDLIKALMELENSASQDAIVREKIANLPAEVQDVSLLEKIEGMGHE